MKNDNRLIKEIKAALKSEDTESHLKVFQNEIKMLLELEYVLSVINFVNQLDTIFTRIKDKFEVVEMYIKLIEPGKYQYLNCFLELDESSNAEINKEINKHLNKFSVSSIEYFLDNFAISIDLKEYSKNDLSEKIYKKMLSVEMQKLLNFVVLENDVTMNNSDISNLRKIKI